MSCFDCLLAHGCSKTRPDCILLRCEIDRQNHEALASSVRSLPTIAKRFNERREAFAYYGRFI